MRRFGLVVMAYGTPAGTDGVEEYYTHIRRGRPPTPELLADLVGRYDAIGGVSPLAERTRDQVEAIADALDAADPGAWTVTLGNKHVAPFLEDAVTRLVAGTHRDGGGPPAGVVGLVLAPHHSRGSVGEYHERARTVADGHGVAYLPIDSWHDEPAWLDAQAGRVRAALRALPAATTVLFSAHSLPERVLAGDDYVDELEASAAAIAARAGLAPGAWRLAWQSAGRTPEPWRGPDVLDVIRDLGAAGDADGVLVCPQGFVSDHLEVLYDLDVDARRVAGEAGLAFGRTGSINDERAVMRALAERVRRTAGIAPGATT